MRFALDSRRLMVPMLVIGMLAVALTLVCSEGVHPPLSHAMDGGCAVMGHSGLAAGTLGSDSAQALVSQLIVLTAGLTLATAMVVAPVRLMPVVAAPSPPPDPRFGRLRI